MAPEAVTYKNVYYNNMYYGKAKNDCLGLTSVSAGAPIVYSIPSHDSIEHNAAFYFNRTSCGCVLLAAFSYYFGVDQVKAHACYSRNLQLRQVLYFPLFDISASGNVGAALSIICNISVDRTSSSLDVN